MSNVIVYQPDDAADFLPAAWYVTAERTRVPHRHRLLGLAILAIAVGAGLAAPVAGAITVTAGITVLRAAGRVTESLAARRHARRLRGWGLLALLASVPWILAWAMVETVLLAPLLLLAAAIAVVIAISVSGGGHPALAAAAVAGVYTVLVCLGPTSRGPRRQLNRVLDPVARSPLTIGTVMLLLSAVAAGVTFLTVLGSPAFWPAQGWPSALVRLTGTESGLCPPPPPVMRLTMLCAAPHGAAQGKPPGHAP